MSGTGRHAGRPRGHPRRLRHPPSFPTCPLCTPGSSATSATTSCARSSTCRTFPTTTSATPTPCCRSSASWPPSTTGASGSCSSTTWSSTRPGTRPTHDAAYQAAEDRLDQLAADCFRPPRTAGPPPARAVPARPTTCVRTMSDELLPRRRAGGQGAHHGRRHLPGGALPALRPRARGRPLRRLPGAAPGQPEPVPLLPPLPRRHRGGRLARAHGPPPRRDGHLAAHRRVAAAGGDRRRTTPTSRASWSRTRRSWPST